MPIYEYKGQQYDITTEDPAEAKAKILGFIEKQPPAPAPRVPDFAGNAAMSPQEQAYASSQRAGIASLRTPSAVPEMTQYTPSLPEMLMGLLPGDKAKAANEYAARKAAEERGVSTEEIYKGAGGARPMFNPEGRAPILAGTQAGTVIAKELPNIPQQTAVAALQAVRAGDIGAPGQETFLDKAINYMTPETPKGEQDKNYDAFQGLSKSMGFSLTTMVSSIVGAAAGTSVAGFPGGVAGGMGASGTVAYRSSKDDFLSRVRDKLNQESIKLYNKPISKADWENAKKEFDSAASSYGAWEAVPEALSNAIMLKAFTGPARAAAGAGRLEQFMVKNNIAEKIASYATENITETTTGLGQRAAELKAGLSTEELSIADAFRQQFIQTLLMSGGMQVGEKATHAASRFYQDKIEPRINPGSALGKAIMADLNAVEFSQSAINKEAIARLAPQKYQQEKLATEKVAKTARGIAMPPPPEEKLVEPPAAKPPVEPAGIAGLTAAPSESMDTEAMLREALGQAPAGVATLPPVKVEEPKAAKGLADRIGLPQGPARENAANEEIPLDDKILLRDMVVKSVENGLASGKTRQQIIDQLEALTKGGISNSDIARIHDYLTESGVKETPAKVEPTVAETGPFVRKQMEAQAPTTPTPVSIEGALSGIETPKAKQAEAQEQQAPAANVIFSEGQQKLKDALDSNGRIFIDSTDEAGKKTYYAKGVGSTDSKFAVELQLTQEEKRAARIAEGDMELADTQEERNAARQALENALRPAANRATKQQEQQAPATPAKKLTTEQDYYDTFQKTASPEAKAAFDNVEKTLGSVVAAVNNLGYEVTDPKIKLNSEASKLKDQYNALTADRSNLLSGHFALQEKFNNADQNKFNAAIKRANTSANNAQQVIRKAVPRPQEVIEAEQRVTEGEKAISKIKGKPGRSLWTALTGKLGSSDIAELFGKSPQIYQKKLQAKKDTSGKSIADMVSDGDLDDFLPFQMRSNVPGFDGQDAEEYIKDQVRGQNYIPYDAQVEIEQIFGSVEEAEKLINDYLTTEEQNLELQEAADEQRQGEINARSVEPESEIPSTEPDEGEALTKPTPEGLRAKEKYRIEAEAKEAAEAKANKEAGDRAKADKEVGEFTLTGSDRAADVAAARGQKDLLAEEEAPVNEDGVKVVPFEADSETVGKLLSETREEEEPSDIRRNALMHSTEKPAKPKPTEMLTPEEAKAQIDEWKAEAARQGKANKNYNKTILSLFDASGEWARPWQEAGYDVHTFDIQTGEDINDFSAEYLLENGYGDLNIWGILAAPPCTDFASSGAQFWAKKDAKGQTEISNELVMQVIRTVNFLQPKIWAMENPVGRIAKLNNLPPAHLTFDPNYYGDPYTKKTLLWGNFENNLPMAPVEPTEGSKIVKLSGKDKYARSLTPEGFAYAFFMANNAESMTPAERLTRTYYGVDPKAFEGATEADEKAIDDSEFQDKYYDGNLEEAATIARYIINGEQEIQEEPPSEDYQKAVDESNKAIKAFNKIQEAYRAQEIGDDEFLAGRKVYDAAMKKFDTAYAAEQEPAEPAKTPTTALATIDNKAILKDALRIHELNIDLQQISGDDGKKIEDYSAKEIYSEAKYILGLFLESGTMDNDAYIGEHGPEEQKAAKDSVKKLQALIKKYADIEVLGPAEKPAAPQLTNEPYTIEGEFTEIGEEKQHALLSNQTSKLSEDQTKSLEAQYGAKRGSAEFLDSVRKDVIAFITEGAKAVNGKIRAIIRQLANGVLSVAIVFNPQFVSKPYTIAVPQYDIKTSEVIKDLPKEAQSMSDAAKRAYGVIYPALEAQLKANDKLFIVADKRSGNTYLFNPDGSLLLQSKTLFGKAIGDYMHGDNEIEANRITPAGVFDLGLRDAKRSAGEAYTAGEYDFGKVFVLDKSNIGKNGPYSNTIMHSVWTNETDAKQRLAALEKPGAEDSRYSFGCINVNKETFKYLITNHLNQMDGAKIFIVPENGANVMDFINGKAMNSDDIIRQKVEPVTKTTVTEKQVPAPKPSIERKQTGRETEVAKLEVKTEEEAPGKEPKEPKEQTFYDIGVDQTETPAFKRWFGNSKIVDADGNPLVMYRGEKKGSTYFKSGKPARLNQPIFVTPSFILANKFAGVKKTNQSIFGGGFITPVYVKAQNTFDYQNKKHLKLISNYLESIDESVLDDLLAETNNEKIKDYIHELEYSGHDNWSAIEMPVVWDWLQANFDSVYVGEEGVKNLAVFSPNQIKSAIGNIGTFDESNPDIRYSIEGKKLPPGRSPELAAAAKEVKAGRMSAAEFDKLVNKYRPIYLYQVPLKPATPEQMVEALSSDKKEKINPTISDGTRVGLRLDIPAFNRKGVYVVSIHEKGNKSGPGKVIGYDSVAVINNVTFGLGSQTKALDIATGASKDALQTMEGEYVKTDPSTAYVNAVEAMNDPAWTQIAVDPTRHAYFYDRNTTQPVIAAEQVIQIGNMVLAKNVTYGDKADYLYNIGKEGYAEQEQKKRSDSLKRTLKTLNRMRKDGRITDEQFVERADAAIAADEDQRLAEEPGERVRGADFIRQKLLEAKRKKFISEDAADMAEWFINQNPALVDDLGISIIGKGARGAVGQYNPFSRILTLIKGLASDTTTVHEILHHLERMMPTKVQQAIRRAWSSQLAKATKKAKTPAEKLYFAALRDAHYGSNRHSMLIIPEGAGEVYSKVRKALEYASEDGSSSNFAGTMLGLGLVPTNLYEYFNPSEFWAVNGSDIVRARFEAVRGGVLARLKNWLKEFAQKIKSLFGLKSDASIIRALDSLAKADGQFVTQEMLGEGDYLSIERRNFQGNEAPQPAFEAPIPSAMDTFAYNFLDKQHDMRSVINEIQKVRGELVKEQIDPYLKNESFISRKAAREENFVDNSIMPIVQEMYKNKVSILEVEEYMHNRHAEERNIQVAKINPSLPDGGSGITTANALKYLSELPENKLKIYNKIAKMFDGVVDETQQILVESGAETQKTINDWNNTYEYYAPLQREDLDFVNHGVGNGGGLGSRGSFSKRAFGSTKNVANILQNIVLQHKRAIDRAERIRVGKSLMGLVLTNPNPNFWIPVNPNAIKSIKKFKEEVQSLGISADQAENMLQEPKAPSIDKETGLVKYAVNPAMRSMDNVFPVRINGQDWFIIFNPSDERAMRMVKSLRNLDVEKLGIFMGTAGMITRWISAINTQYNPIFGAFNFGRDVGTGLLQLSTTELAGQQSKVMKSVMPALAAIFKEQRGWSGSKNVLDKDELTPQEWRDLYQRYRLAGGKIGISANFTQQKTRLEKLEKGWGIKGLLSVRATTDEISLIDKKLAEMDRGKIMAGAHYLFDYLSDYNEAMENAVRLATFKVAVLDNNMSDDKGVSLAKNVTVNFDKKGAVVPKLQAWYSFINPSIQGAVVVKNVLTGPKGKIIIAGGIGLGVMQALLLFAAGFDDDDPPEFVKSKAFVVPTGDGKYFIVYPPYPPGFSMLPGIGRMLTEAFLIKSKAMKSNESASDKIFDILPMMLDSVNPMGIGATWQQLVPTPLDPIANVIVNKNAFGRPIAKTDRPGEETPGYERSRDSASSISKGIAYFLNWSSSPAGTTYTKGKISPTADQLDYFAEQYFGGVFREMVKAGESIGAKVKGEEQPMYRVPLAGKFFGETKTPAATSSRFYNNIEIMNTHEHEIKKRQENREPTSEYLKDNPEAKLWKEANAAQKTIGNINKEKKAATARGASKETIDAINERKVRAMKAFNDKVRAAQ